MRALLLATLLLAAACDDEIEVETRHKLCETDADCTAVAIDCCCEFRGVNLDNVDRYQSRVDERFGNDWGNDYGNDFGPWNWCGCECPSELVKCGDGRCYAEREWLDDEEYYGKWEGPPPPFGGDPDDRNPDGRNPDDRDPDDDDDRD